MIGLLRQLLAAILSFLLVAPTFSYARNRLTNLAVNNSTASIESYAYTLDAAGHLLSVSELSGRTVNYGYDNLYRLTSETIASDPHSINGAVSYTYDSVGNRKQITSTLAPVPAGLWNYNANDQFTAGDFYDANGNTTSSGGIANVYDFENHLIQKGGVTIVYDGDGNRVSKTVTGITTTYLVDTLNPTGYAQVVYESFSGSSSGNRELNHSYVYGLELISQTRSYVANFNSATQKIYYVYDGHGSVRVLTDPTGAVTDTYDYDAFGNLVHSTGTTPNNYLFAGEQFDPDLNLYYNRARYLNVTTARFWSMDTYEGDSISPTSLHKYLYASGDPIDRSDPLGNDDIGDLAVSFAVNSTLSSLSNIVAPIGPGGPAWQILAHTIVPGWVWNSLASSLTPDAVDVGFSFTGTRPFGPVSISGGPGLEALFSGKTAKWAAYLSASLLANFGGSALGTTLAGTAGLVYNLPMASDYAGPFLNFSVPASLLPSNFVAKISAGLTAAYGGLAAATGSRGAYLAFLAASDGIYTILADSSNLTLNVFWGSGNVWGVTVSLGPANKTPHLQLGVNADILLTADVPFE
jgi:RHS repeat-associated protein